MLRNVAPEFRLTSSTENDDFPEQFDMIRHGDVVTVTFRTVLIDPAVLRSHRQPGCAHREPRAATRPAPIRPRASRSATGSTVWYEEFCNGTRHGTVSRANRTTSWASTKTIVGPDPRTSTSTWIGTELLFILTSTGDPLPLTVELTNNGGHDASDYQAWVTFGEAMLSCRTRPAGCAHPDIPPEPKPPVWKLPDTLPDSGARLRLRPRSAVGPGVTERLDLRRREEHRLDPSTTTSPSAPT